MRSLPLLAVLLSFAASALPGFCAGPAEIAPADWTTLQVDNKEDGSITVEPSGVRMKRGALGGKGYFMRAYRDIPVEPATRYLFTYSVAVEGTGYANAFFYVAGADGKWDEKATMYGERKGAGDHAGVRFIVNVPADKVKLRMCLGFGGSNAGAVFREVSFGPIGSTKAPLVAPSTAAVVLDGKLDDPIWKTATRLASFRVLGKPGTEAAQQTEAFLALRDGMLYLGCRAREEDTAGLKLSAPSNCHEIYADDCLEVFLSLDRMSYSHLLMNAAGKFYWLKKDVGGARSSWFPVMTAAAYRGDWEAKGAVGKGEWTVEARIRLSDFLGASGAGDTTVYMNVGRHRPRGAEEYTTWTPLAGATFHNPKDYQPVVLKLPGGRSEVTEAANFPFTTRLTEPELMTSGKPVNLRLRGGRVALPASVRVVEKGAGLAADVKAFLAANLAQGSGPAAELILEKAEQPFPDASLSAAERKLLDSPEAFRLEIAPQRLTLAARHGDGLARGAATLVLLARQAKDRGDRSLPNLLMQDAPRIAFRSWLVHIGKTPETMRAIIDCAWLLRYNKIFIALDNFGAAAPPFPYKTADIGEAGRTQQEWVEVFQYARDRGLEPIPYLASWGRIQYISYKPEYRWIDAADHSDNHGQPYYRNLDVANPEAVKLMLALQEEMIDVLKPKGFNIAFDEIHFGPLVASKLAQEKKWKNSDWVIASLKAQDGLLRRKKVDCYLWGDEFDPGQNGNHIDITGPAMLAKLPKDWIMMDWKYEGKYDSLADFPSYDMFMNAGFRTLGCPWYKPFNVARWVKTVYEKKGFGVCQTSWSATEVHKMTPELSRAVALCAHLAWSPEDTELSHLDFVPDALFKTACFRTNAGMPARSPRYLATPEPVVAGEELAEGLGFPKGFGLDFIRTPASNWRGADFRVFTKNGKTAAVYAMGRGGPGEIKNGDFSLGLAGWAMNGSAEEASFKAEDGALRAERLKKGAFIRVAQDIPLVAGKQYVLLVKLKTTGAAKGRVWMYGGESDRKWDAKGMVQLDAGASADWLVKEFPVAKTNAFLRVCLSPEGEGTVWFDDVELREVGATAVTRARVASVRIPVNQAASVLTFLHAANMQFIPESLNMGDTAKRYASQIPGTYVVRYEDGGSAILPLQYRQQVSGIDDPSIGREADPVLFGTVGDRQFVNIGSFTWKNPQPERRIQAVELVPGNSSELGLALFALTLE